MVCLWGLGVGIRGPGVALYHIFLGVGSLVLYCTEFSWPWLEFESEKPSGTLHTPPGFLAVLLLVVRLSVFLCSERCFCCLRFPELAEEAWF